MNLPSDKMAEKQSSVAEIKEVWLPVVGYEKQYEVSSLGGIRRVSEVLYRFVESSGYYLVKLSKNGDGKSHRLHTLIAADFHGERPEGLVVDHRDGDKFNNCADNLRYVTPSENNQWNKNYGR